MAPPANPIFPFALFVALFLSISTEAREMSTFAKFSPTFHSDSDSENDRFQQNSNDNHGTDSYDPSKEDENNTPWYQRNTQSGQTEEKRYPNTYTPWYQQRSHGSSEESHYSQYESGRFSSPPTTKNDFYNSNPFYEEDSNVKRGGKTSDRYSQDNNQVSEAQGMSDVRKMYNGKFNYDVNDESKHGALYNTNYGKYSNVNSEEGYGQQREDKYESKGQQYDATGLNDPERLSAYDP